MKFTKLVKADSMGAYQNMDIFEKINDLYNIVDELRDAYNKTNLTSEQANNLIESLDVSIDDLKMILRLINYNRI